MAICTFSEFLQTNKTMKTLLKTLSTSVRPAKLQKMGLCCQVWASALRISGQTAIKNQVIKYVDVYFSFGTAGSSIRWGKCAGFG